MKIESFNDLKSHYDVIFIADYLVKYKTRLYEKIQQHKSVLIIYDNISNSYRKPDFYDYGPHSFDSFYIDGSRKEKIAKLKKLKVLIRNSTLIISGWSEILPIYSILKLKAKCKCIISESGVYESTLKGPKAWLKKFFLRKIDLAFVPGIANEELLKKLKFKGKIVQTHGVGLYNRIEQPAYVKKDEVKNFIYVGRMIELKNVRNLVKAFGSMPQFNLTMCGDGVLLEELKGYGFPNVKFAGSVPNVELSKYYQESDVFILPSFGEPWGLVVEEALNNGLPFIASNHICAAEDFLLRSKVGLIFDLDTPNDLSAKIQEISNPELYNALKKNVCNLDFVQIENNQVQSFVENII